MTHIILGSTFCKKECFFSGIARITSPPLPQYGQLVPLLLDVKNDVLACITEPSDDNYDHNFGTFDDLVLKMNKKYHKT